MWAQIESLLPPPMGAMGRPMTDHRPAVEGAIYRDRTGIAWRGQPGEFFPWHTSWWAFALSCGVRERVE
jgi:transposase